MDNNFLPNVTTVPLSSEAIDAALAGKLDIDSLLRIKSVNDAIRVIHGRPVKNQKEFVEMFESIYNHYSKKNLNQNI